jgi:hypothetical protein
MALANGGLEHHVRGHGHSLSEARRMRRICARVNIQRGDP